MGRARRRRRGDDGAAAVEFALVAMPLFALLFGIIQYGLVLYQVQGAASAVKDAGRWASLGIVDCGDWATDALDRAAANGVGANLNPTVSADFKPSAGGRPVVVVKLNFTPIPVVPFVPLPSTITREAEFDVEYLPPTGITDTGGTECTG
jgi:hypothetical protein